MLLAAAAGSLLGSSSSGASAAAALAPIAAAAAARLRGLSTATAAGVCGRGATRASSYRRSGTTHVGLVPLEGQRRRKAQPAARAAIACSCAAMRARFKRCGGACDAQSSSSSYPGSRITRNNPTYLQPNYQKPRRRRRRRARPSRCPARPTAPCCCACRSGRTARRPSCRRRWPRASSVRAAARGASACCARRLPLQARRRRQSAR